MASVKKTKKVLGAKVKVTKQDAKQAEPLVRYWADRLKTARYSDNWQVLFLGLFMGIILGFIAGV